MKPHLRLCADGRWECMRVTFGGRIVRGYGETPLAAYESMNDYFFKRPS